MQRVLMARALVGEPKILLLDEPTAMVDEKAGSAIYELIESLKGDVTMMMVTHHINKILNQVDRVFVVEKTLQIMEREEVCRHFGIGVYHSHSHRMGGSS